ncbi:ABC transporter ATP-binding protein [Kitasatospora sp. GAS204B]|uniref:ABC transporter ATP-binding protein n=1 Tax=unclassified Kitasatospora TaxID=2633591 RepID=UPI0024743845|nr:ABC transporter ATP-binding protein [Kitasatospora sp. GAS204B]MDH6121977.1 ABC-2 type transport system ATP-binding protein [Kitasatospora sp. GAS204B]
MTVTVPQRAAVDRAEQEPAILVSGLRMRYGRRDVLDGLDLRVHRAELFALLGPNGAGKSTTIEVLEGYRLRSGGEVSVLGQDPARDDPAWRARIGIVLQSNRDHGRWRVAELLDHFARYYEHPREPAELLRRVGLAAQADQSAATLSGGQRRRLDVALGLVGSPELLFLDEPTTGFDPEARRDFHALLRELREERATTIVLTTHDLTEAQELADRIGILESGRLTACGTLEELAAAARADSEVRWRGPDGEPRRLLTADPSQAVWELHQEFGGPIPDLEVRRPTLEDTYLGMVGADLDTTEAS